MRKVAVYVEGMTELVFVYHCIQAYYQSDWTAFHLYYVSVSPSDRIALMNRYGDETAENQFTYSGPRSATKSSLKRPK